MLQHFIVSSDATVLSTSDSYFWLLIQVGNGDRADTAINNFCPCFSHLMPMLPLCKLLSSFASNALVAVVVLVFLAVGGVPGCGWFWCSWPDQLQLATDFAPHASTAQQTAHCPPPAGISLQFLRSLKCEACSQREASN